VEILKQNQNSPMSVGQMVASIYAANGGYIDGVDVKNIVDFESKMQERLKISHGDLLEKLSKDWNPEIETELKDFLSLFVKNYAN
jgi:F-type H+-transporting ATPase subunit alpha